MFENEIIVYVEKDRKQHLKCNLTDVCILKDSLQNGRPKIIYFEKFINKREAESRLKKMQTLNRLKLIELIEGSNPEM